MSQDEIQDKLVIFLSALDDMADIINQSASFEYTSKYLLRLILGTVGITKGAIYIYVSGKSEFRLQTSTFSFPAEAFSLSVSNEFSQQIASISEPIFLDKIPDDFREILGSLITSWNLAGVRLVIPLAVRENLIGIACLGQPFSSEDYTPQILKILQLLIHHVSITFYNHKLLKETEKANFRMNHKMLEMEQLYDIGLALTELRSLESLTEEIMIRATSILDASYGALWMAEPDGRHILTYCFGFHPEDIPIIIQDIAPDIQREANSQLALSVPMAVKQKHLGYLAVGGKESRDAGFRAFTTSDQQLLSAFANQAAVALENAHLYREALEKERMDREIQLAAEIQQTLLPDKSPVIPHLEVACRTIPCRTVGGDFFDFYTPDKNHHVAVVADVSGKGVPAALLVSTFHAALHMAYPRLLDPAEVAGSLNNLIVDATPGNKFITAVFILWNSMTQKMTYLTAGHEPPVIFRKAGPIEFLSKGGMVLGVFHDIQFTTEEVEFEIGDTLILYTDGLTDVQNSDNERFGIDRLIQCCKDVIEGSSEEIITEIFHAIDQFKGDLASPDDETVVVIRRI